MNSIKVVNSVIIRKLSDGEELVITGAASVPKTAANPRELALERRREALLGEAARRVQTALPRPPR